MPYLNDRARIRAILETDRNWSVYALGDLAPENAAHCEWHAAPDDAALLLIYRAFDLPVLFALGPPAAVAPLLAEVHEPRLYLLAQPAVLPLLAARGTIQHQQAMWRMVLRPAAFPGPAPCPGLAALSLADFPALEALYADGAAAGEAPDFFNRAQVAGGVFWGVRTDGGLTAAAGTHLVAPELGVGAVGNVYVRRDQRGRGLGRAVTAAVTAALLERGLATIALNVNQLNTPALRTYTGLGFERTGAFYEGVWEHC